MMTSAQAWGSNRIHLMRWRNYGTKRANCSDKDVIRLQIHSDEKRDYSQNYNFKIKNRILVHNMCANMTTLHKSHTTSLWSQVKPNTHLICICIFFCLYGSEVIQSHITLKLWYLDDITDYILKKGYIVNVTVPLWLLGESNAKVGASLHILSNQSN